MRREPTFAEKALWKLLRERRLSGLRFRRQVPMGSYIADFVCFSPRLIVEVDGAAHWNPDYDDKRDAWFREQAFTVLRFSNDDVIGRSSDVIIKILETSGRGDQRRP